MKSLKLIPATTAAIAALAIAGCAETEVTTEPNNGAAVTASNEAKPNKPKPKHEKPAKPAETSAQENARESAESYLDTSAFSRSGLIEQLEYEDFSTADATYAVGSITVDWNEQAAKSAESYLDTSSFSRSGLIDQLEYEGFTKAQAAHGVAAAY